MLLHKQATQTDQQQIKWITWPV